MKADMKSRSIREETEKAAAAWLMRRGDPDWSATDEAAFEQWLAAAPGHRVSFVRLESIWTEADRLKSIASGLPKGRTPPRGAIEQSPFFTLKQAPSGSVGRRSWITRFALAASVLLVCAAGYLGWDQLRVPRYSTAVGVTTAIPTPDGSVVTLNTDSAVKIRFTDTERGVQLDRGEAFFEVAKDPARPFVVTAGDRRVVALGTAFSVRRDRHRDGGGLRVVVTEGKVRLDPLPAQSPTGEVVLTPGVVADIRDSAVSVQQRSVPAVERALSWRSGYIALDGTPLGEAVAEFNRYNIRQLVIGDPVLATVKVEGYFRSTNLDGFVRLLEEGFEIRAEEAGSGRIVLSGK